MTHEEFNQFKREVKDYQDKVKTRKKAIMKNSLEFSDRNFEKLGHTRNEYFDSDPIVKHRSVNISMLKDGKCFMFIPTSPKQ